jgi:hypothetical protein
MAFANAPLMESVWADAGTATADGFLGVPYRTTTNDQQTNILTSFSYTGNFIRLQRCKQQQDFIHQHPLPVGNQAG